MKTLLHVNPRSLSAVISSAIDKKWDELELDWSEEQCALAESEAFTAAGACISVSPSYARCCSASSHVLCMKMASKNCRQIWPSTDRRRSKSLERAAWWACKQGTSLAAAEANRWTTSLLSASFVRSSLPLEEGSVICKSD